jgi:hypothetical protein
MLKGLLEYPYPWDPAGKCGLLIMWEMTPIIFENKNVTPTIREVIGELLTHINYGHLIKVSSTDVRQAPISHADTALVANLKIQYVPSVC